MIGQAEFPQSPEVIDIKRHMSLVHEHVFAGRLMQVRVQSAVFGRLVRASSDAELRERHRQFVSHVRGQIGRSLIDDQHFKSSPQIGEDFQNVLQILRQGPFRIEYRKDHTQRTTHRYLPSEIPLNPRRDSTPS